MNFFNTLLNLTFLIICVEIVLKTIFGGQREYFFLDWDTLDTVNLFLLIYIDVTEIWLYI